MEDIDIEGNRCPDCCGERRAHCGARNFDFKDLRPISRATDGTDPLGLVDPGEGEGVLVAGVEVAVWREEVDGVETEVGAAPLAAVYGRHWRDRRWKRGSFCHNCRKNLNHGSDIYMFRGEKTFYSDECHYEGMMMEENHGAPGVEESESW